eukprot:9345525-Pyramimonas_sp.AAC.1
MGVCPGPKSITGQPQSAWIRASIFQSSGMGPTAAERPTAPPMDFLLYPDYHAQITGNPRVGMQPECTYVRATADDFFQS